MIRTRHRSSVKKYLSVKKSERMAAAFLRHVYQGDRQREARAEFRAYDRQVNKTRDHHTGDGRITVFRRE